MVSKRKQNGPGTAITKYSRVTSFVKEPNTDLATSLALMHIHYDFYNDLHEIVDVFVELHPRRMQLSSVLLETR